jgi:hypothetical protein
LGKKQDRKAPESALKALHERGVATLGFQDLITEPDLWHELTADMEGFREQAENVLPAAKDHPEKKDEYLIRRNRRLVPHGDDGKLTLSVRSPWLRLGASDAVLDIVNAYRGERSKLVDVDQWYTVPFAAEYDRIASQRWHRDPEDQHVVKVFVYFSDVDEQAGPFQYIPESAEGFKYGHLWPWGSNWYPPQDEMETRIPASEHLTLTGKTGTVILCDTSGFHRGGFAERKPRLLSYHTYVSERATEKRHFSVDWSGDGADLSEQGRFALS